MISFRNFDVSKYKIAVRLHAMLRALERDVEPDIIELIVRTGKHSHFGKQGIKVIKKGKRTITCVCEVQGDEIVVLTVEVN